MLQQVSPTSLPRGAPHFMMSETIGAVPTTGTTARHFLTFPKSRGTTHSFLDSLGSLPAAAVEVSTSQNLAGSPVLESRTTTPVTRPTFRFPRPIMTRTSYARREVA